MIKKSFLFPFLPHFLSPSVFPLSSYLHLLLTFPSLPFPLSLLFLFPLTLSFTISFFLPRTRKRSKRENIFTQSTNSYDQHPCHSQTTELGITVLQTRWKSHRGSCTGGPLHRPGCCSCYQLPVIRFSFYYSFPHLWLLVTSINPTPFYSSQFP